MTSVTKDHKKVGRPRKSSELEAKASNYALLEYVSSLANTEFLNRRKTMKSSYNKELDQKVYEWYVSETRKGESLIGPDICNKALELNNILGGTTDFKASSGWLKNFKYRHGISLSGSNLNFQVAGLGSNEIIPESTSDNIQIPPIASHDGVFKMPPKRKRKHVMLSLKDKLNIISRLQKGETGSDLAREYNIGKSTVNDIKTKQEALLSYVNTFPNCNNLKRKTMKSAFNKNLDRAVYRWYCECLKNGISVSGPAVCDKALDLNHEFGGDPEFKASSGWLQNFKIRHGLHFSVNGRDAVTVLDPQEFYPNIYLEEGTASSSKYNGSNQSICLPNSDADLSVCNENNISSKNNDESHVYYKDASENVIMYNDTACKNNDESIVYYKDASEKEILYNDTDVYDVSFADESAKTDELSHAFKLVIDWTKRQNECSSSDVINLLKLHELACVKGMPDACSTNYSAIESFETNKNEVDRRDESISVDRQDESISVDRRDESISVDRRDESISVDDMYEIDRCIKWIKDNRFPKVALQFPQGMLHDAMTVSQRLEEKTKSDMFVIGNTSLESCCIDELSFEHISADAIIHFGHSCLSPTEKLPVLYVFGKQVIEIQDTANAFQKLFPDKKSHVILLYEVMYSYAIDYLAEMLKEYNNLVIPRLEIPGEDSKIFRASNVKEITLFTKLHRHLLIPSELSLSDYKVFYVGSRPAVLTNYMFKLNYSQFYSYNPPQKLTQVETLDSNKYLRRRYDYIAKAKVANTIGILVRTVGVSDITISHLQKLIMQAGKKSHILAVSKLNDTKLTSFAEIEIFVNLACEESSLNETRDFKQPIITPFELEISLNQAQCWTGDYIADFAKLLPAATSCVLSMEKNEVKCKINGEGTI